MEKLGQYKNHEIWADNDGNVGVGKKIGHDRFFIVPLVRYLERPGGFTILTASDWKRGEKGDNFDHACLDLADDLKSLGIKSTV